MLEGLLADIAPDWSTDGYGMSSLLIAPDGCVIEQDGECPHGYVSPLITAGMI